MQDNWKIGEKVNIGMLKGVEVTNVVQQGDLIQYHLKDAVSGKEYTFVPGGLRKTFEPPAPLTPVYPSSNNIPVRRSLMKLEKVLKTQCRRKADAPIVQELREVIGLLKPLTSPDGDGGEKLASGF